MESSQTFEGMEECHSSESGWTMYLLGSSTHGDDDSDGESSLNNGGGGRDKTKDDDSDDSMASDASSGRSYREQGSRGKGKCGGRVLLDVKKDIDKAKGGRRRNEETKKNDDDDDVSNTKMVKKKVNFLRGKRN